MWQIAASLVLLAFSTFAALAQQKPKVPVGVDPGGVRVAIIGTGLDYTDPALAQRLARDGEGTLISVDFLAQDFRAFEPEGSRPGTVFAVVMARMRPEASLVAARVTTGITTSEAKSQVSAVLPVLVAFAFPPVAQSRVVVVTAAAMAPVCAERKGVRAMAAAVNDRHRDALEKRAAARVSLVVIAPCPTLQGQPLTAALVGDGVDLVEVAEDTALGDAGQRREDRVALRLAVEALVLHAAYPGHTARQLREAIKAGAPIDLAK